MDYCCGNCGRTIVKADQPIAATFTAKCPRCREITELEAAGRDRPLHVTYRCSNDDCGRTLRVERPVADRAYCVDCGTTTLEEVEESRPEPVTSASPAIAQGT